MPVQIKNMEQVLRSMISFMRSSKMGQDVDIKIGSVTREIVLDPIAFTFQNAYQDLRTIQRSQTIIYSDEMTEEDMDNLVSNWFLKRKAGQKAIGNVTFYSIQPPTDNLVIPAGTVVRVPAKDGNASLDYITTKTANLNKKSVYTQNRQSVSAKDGYFDVNLGVYCVDALIESNEAGIKYNCLAGEITQISSGVQAVKVINKEDLKYGTDKESNSELASRQREVLYGVSKGTKGGYVTRLKQNVIGIKDVYVVGPKHEYMMRDGGYGGKLDIYVVARPFETEQRQEIIIKEIDENPNGVDYIFVNQPVRSITTVELLKNGFSVPDTEGGPVFLLEAQLMNEDFTEADYGDYILIKDYDVHGGSIYGEDKIRFFTKIAAGSADSLLITYDINKTIVDSQTNLNLEGIETDDVLAKEAEEVLFLISMTIDIFDNYDPFSLRSSIKSKIVDFYSGTKLGTNIQQDDIRNEVRKVDGVDNIVVPFDKFITYNEKLVAEADEQIVIRTVSNSDIIFDHQPIVSITRVEWIGATGDIIKKFKQDTDVIVVENENICKNGIPHNKEIVDNVTPSPENPYPTSNSAKDFYFKYGRLRNKGGDEVTIDDIVVNGTISNIVDIQSEVIVNISGVDHVLAKITFDTPPSNQEILASIYVSYYYDDGILPDYELVRDDTDNAYTISAQDKMAWLKEFDKTLGDQIIRIYYEYDKLQIGDISLTPRQFASIQSSDIDIKIRNVVSMVNEELTRTNATPESELDDV